MFLFASLLFHMDRACILTGYYRQLDKVTAHCVIGPFSILSNVFSVISLFCNELSVLH